MAGKLHTPAKPPSLKRVLARVLLVVLILFVIVLVLHFDEGLIDTTTGEHPGFLDSLYFTMVTITTVGYGDIVPVSTRARMVDAFFLTPMRFIVFILFVGIAYDMSMQKLREDYRMNRAVGKLKGHTIVCGYGETGRAAVEELLSQGTPPDQIVVLEMDPGLLDDAVARGVVAVLGDATRESVLKSVALERAAHVLVSPGRDDTAVLIALTAHDLNPSAKLVVMCHESENVRLVERSGADTIISPAAAGGNLMAAATRQPHIVATLKDILSVRGTLRMDEREVRAEEVGKYPHELEKLAPVRVYRDGKHFDVEHLPKLEAGDVLVYVSGVSAE